MRSLAHRVVVWLPTVCTVGLTIALLYVLGRVSEPAAWAVGGIALVGIVFRLIVLGRKR